MVPRSEAVAHTDEVAADHGKAQRAVWCSAVRGRTPSLSVFGWRTKARRLVGEKQVKFIIIDYLRL